MFKKFTPLWDVYSTGHDHTIANLRFCAILLIAITFMVIGLIMLFIATRPTPQPRRSKTVTKLYGLFTCFCAVARGIEAYAFYQNYGVLLAYAELITGVTSLITLAFFPSIVKEVLSYKRVEDAMATLEETKQELQNFKKERNTP